MTNLWLDAAGVSTNIEFTIGIQKEVIGDQKDAHW
jgi:hypothetical protein